MNRFSVRVYGILTSENQEILVSDEFIRGMKITKFPGGGLEFGEGTRDCLAREFMEELNLKVEVLEHLYTTDFFQISAFNTEYQILSIYYKVRALEPLQVRLSTIPFDFSEAQLQVYEQTRQTETFRFIPRHDFGDDCLDLPIDKVVAAMVKKGDIQSARIKRPIIRHQPLAPEDYELF